MLRFSIPRGSDGSQGPLGDVIQAMQRIATRGRSASKPASFPGSDRQVTMRRGKQRNGGQPIDKALRIKKTLVRNLVTSAEFLR